MSKEVKILIHYFELPNDCKQYNDLMQNDLTHVTKNPTNPKNIFMLMKTAEINEKVKRLKL